MTASVDGEYQGPMVGFTCRRCPRIVKLATYMTGPPVRSNIFLPSIRDDWWLVFDERSQLGVVAKEETRPDHAIEAVRAQSRCKDIH